jgi:hypothetical protein
MAVNLVSYNYGFTGPVGANPIGRTDLADPTTEFKNGGVVNLPLANAGAVVQFDDNRTYSLNIDATVPIFGTNTNPAAQTTIQGASGVRPYIKVTSTNALTASAADLTPGVGTTPFNPDPNAPRVLLIEGLWLGSGNANGDFTIQRSPSSATTLDWDTITISNATLDPGGVRADTTPIPPLRIVVNARVGTIVIERSIVGAIQVVVDPTCVNSGLLQQLVISDSIVDGTKSNNVNVPSSTAPGPAIDCPTGTVTLNGVTVFGDVIATVLLASNTLVLGQVRVRNQEASCFRFSAAFTPTDPSSFPRSFHPPRLATTDGSTGDVIPVDPVFFTSLTFGQPGYASLSLAAPPQIVTGGENGSEMGAFWFMDRPIALRSVQVKVDEFKPAGVIAQYIFQEEHAETTVP